MNVERRSRIVPQVVRRPVARRASRSLSVVVAVVALATCASVALATVDQIEAYRAQGIRPGDVVTGTVSSADVLPGGGKETVALTTYLTGKKSREDAVNVVLTVFRESGGELRPVFTRDYGAVHGAAVGRGEVELLDLDGDGLMEIVVAFDDHGDATIERRRGEVLVGNGDGFDVAWNGEFEYDATRDARTVPAERRDRYVRELDYARTIATRGVTLIFEKRVLAVAGEALAEPKTVTETFPLRKDRAAH